jgi:hypothetical protein
MAPSAVNDTMREMMAATKRWFNRITGRADAGTLIASGGTSTAITVAYDTAPATLYTGLECSFKVTTTCGATPTLNVNSLGAKNLQKWTGGAYADLATDELVAGQHVKVKYDGTLDKWVLLSNSGGQQVYAEGTWTPGLTFGGGSTGMTFSSQSGTYTRIGRVVLFDGVIILTAKGSSTGNALITGLPITPGGTNAASLRVSALTSGVGDTFLQCLVNTDTTISLQDIGSGASAALTHVDFGDTSTVRVSGFYRV